MRMLPGGPTQARPTRAGLGRAALDSQGMHASVAMSVAAHTWAQRSFLSQQKSAVLLKQQGGLRSVYKAPMGLLAHLRPHRNAKSGPLHTAKAAVKYICTIYHLYNIPVTTASQFPTIVVALDA